MLLRFPVNRKELSNLHEVHYFQLCYFLIVSQINIHIDPNYWALEKPCLAASLLDGALHCPRKAEVSLAHPNFGLG
jgi:hypothetical protein